MAAILFSLRIPLIENVRSDGTLVAEHTSNLELHLEGLSETRWIYPIYKILLTNCVKWNDIPV